MSPTIMEFQIRVCPECGRDDRWTPFRGQTHFKEGKRCRGKPVALTAKAEIPDDCNRLRE